MPNDPLQTFRTVEPANYAFGSSSTQASQPFVLHYQEIASVTNPSLPNTVTGTFASLASDRFYPWVTRTADSCYPVAVPNAYDRIYIFPMYTVTSTPNPSSSPFVSFGTYSAPAVVPFGLTPQTRGYSTSNKLNPSLNRLPDDILSKAYPTSPLYLDSRTNGFWIPLPAYAANFSTANGLLAAASSTNPTHVLRAELGAGSAVFLPNDFSLSASTTTGIATGNAQKGNSTVVVGLGTEFQTMGSEEIVVALGANPSGVNMSHTLGTATFKMHFFLMGMFLG